MYDYKLRNELHNDGFATIEKIYSNKEVERIIHTIERKTKEYRTFNISSKLFAIRQLLNNVPDLKELLLNDLLRNILFNHFESDFFLTKAIYFDKPKESNWFVPYHQDISISVKEKHEFEGFKKWTSKNGQHGVIPPVSILENTLTVRIHLDDTSNENGALKVIPKSHLNGINRISSENLSLEN